MPKLNESELALAIESGKVSAVSLDTSIFVRYQCNLHYITLRKLTVLRSHPVKFVLSEVVVEEVKAHIAREAVKSQRELQSALASYAKRWRNQIDRKSLDLRHNIDESAYDLAEREFSDYLLATGAEIIPAARSEAVARLAFERYFDSLPPFEAGDRKKHEFPDAFALLALEEFASDEDTWMLCVSADAGWHRFAESSDRIVCVYELDPVLDSFNEAGHAVAERAMSFLHSAHSPIRRDVEAVLQNRLDENDFDISASDAPTAWDAEPVSAILADIKWTYSTPNVVSVDTESVTFTTDARARVIFTAEFSFYVRDRGDKEDLHIGNSEASTERWIAFDIAIIVSRNVDGEPKLLDATVSMRGLTAIFGRLEPFGHENPMHDKY